MTIELAFKATQSLQLQYLKVRFLKLRLKVFGKVPTVTQGLWVTIKRSRFFSYFYCFISRSCPFPVVSVLVPYLNCYRNCLKLTPCYVQDAAMDNIEGECLSENELKLMTVQARFPNDDLRLFECYSLSRDLPFLDRNSFDGSCAGKPPVARQVGVFCSIRWIL